MKTTVIKETMEQLNRHVEKYLAIHRQIVDDGEVFLLAIRERYGDVDERDVLHQCEMNSIAAARSRMLGDPRKNPWVTTRVQSDLFNQQPVKVPSILVVDGKPKPYYECSVRDGYEWWRARQDHKRKEKTDLREASDKRAEEEAEAAHEAETLEEMMRGLLASGIDPNEVRYAKAQA